jgi:hypothetical protein
MLPTYSLCVRFSCKGRRCYCDARRGSFDGVTCFLQAVVLSECCCGVGRPRRRSWQSSQPWVGNEAFLNFFQAVADQWQCLVCLLVTCPILAANSVQYSFFIKDQSSAFHLQDHQVLAHRHTVNQFPGIHLYTSANCFHVLHPHVLAFSSPTYLHKTRISLHPSTLLQLCCTHAQPTQFRHSHF